MRLIYVFLFCFYSFLIVAQHNPYDFSNKAIELRLRKDIEILASDSLNGRLLGSDGELKARKYIINEFKEIGLKPYFGDTSFEQHFAVNFRSYSRKIGNELTINGEILRLYRDFYPLSHSSNDTVKGQLVRVNYMISESGLAVDAYDNLNDIEGKIFVLEISIPGSFSKETKSYKYDRIGKRIDRAIKMGASAIIFINSDRRVSNPSDVISNDILPKSIPVLFYNNHPNKIFKVVGNVDANLMTNIIRPCNVAGYIDNGSDLNIIIGAHYDAMGQIWCDSNEYNAGADDNASGTAAVLEIAKYLKYSAETNKNYIFIAFSAEEGGLLGSEAFVSSNSFNSSHTLCMINFDMIGRLDTMNKKLYLEGSGTSPVWDTINTNSRFSQESIEKIPTSIGGSDHQSFYKKDIPILQFFTGFHKDYHRPSDIAGKINYKGEVEIIKLSESMINQLDKLDKMPFQKISVLKRFQGFRISNRMRKDARK